MKLKFPYVARYLVPPEHLEEIKDTEERFEAQVKYKEKMLGNVKLVGQLLVQGILSAKVIMRCCDQLLQVGNEETLETLSA